MTAAPPPTSGLAALAKGGRTNVLGFALRLLARLPFLFIAGRVYGPELVGRFALAVLAIEFAALVSTLGLKRGLAQALTEAGDRPHAHVVWDGMAAAFVASLAATALLFAFPQAMFPNSDVIGFERLLPLIVFAIAWSDLSLAALAYRHNVKATVLARAVIEPWTISIAAWSLSYVSSRDGLTLAYVLSMLAALVASLVPFVRSYGLPRDWRPRVAPILQLARANIPLAGADAVEWATRNIDRFILGLFFSPAIVGIYYMAQQVASLPQKLKTSFDPVLGPVITQQLREGDKGAIAGQVCQVAFWIMAAQGCLALMGSVPGEAVMGVIGPEFVAGTAALVFLLTAEVAATPGAVAESALVYMARHRNLLISLGVLGFQAALSVVLVLAMRAAGWPDNWQAAGVAVALLVALGAGSAIKVRLLERLLGAPVRMWRWPALWAVLASIVAGSLFTALPPRLEWAELIVGVPVIAGVYAYILWRFSFSDGDRQLFTRLPKGPVEGEGELEKV